MRNCADRTCPVMRIPPPAVCVLLAIMSLSATAAGERTIVLEGRPAAVIIVGDDAGSVAHEAAREIARVIEKMSGASLDIYTESEFLASSTVVRSHRYPADCTGRVRSLQGRFEAGAAAPSVRRYQSRSALRGQSSAPGHPDRAGPTRRRRHRGSAQPGGEAGITSAAPGTRAWAVEKGFYWATPVESRKVEACPGRPTALGCSAFPPSRRRRFLVGTGTM